MYEKTNYLFVITYKIVRFLFNYLWRRFRTAHLLFLLAYAVLSNQDRPL